MPRSKSRKYKSVPITDLQSLTNKFSSVETLYITTKHSLISEHDAAMFIEQNARDCLDGKKFSSWHLIWTELNHSAGQLLNGIVPAGAEALFAGQSLDQLKEAGRRESIWADLIRFAIHLVACGALDFREAEARLQREGRN